MTTTVTRAARRAERESAPSREGGEKSAIASVPLRVIHYVLLGIVAAIMLIPLLWLFSSALKPSEEIYRWPLVWIPSTPEFQNFVDAWTAAPFDRFFFNSIVNAVVSTVIKLVLAVTTAYAFVFLRFPGKNVLFFVLLGALMVPGHVTLIANYLTASQLGWINTFAGLIIPGLGAVFGTFLVRQHMLSIPRELVEAARIDGAGNLRSLWSVVLPISRPVLITVAIVVAIDEWNSYIWPLVITNTVEMRTLPVGLQFLRDSEGLNNWGAIMAGTTMVALPVLIIFFIAQKYIIAGLAAGAVKG